MRISSPGLDYDYTIPGPCFSERSVKNSIVAMAPGRVVFYDEIVDPRPAETQDGHLIVYLHMKRNSVEADCPGLPYVIDPDGYQGDFKEDIGKKIKHAAEDILKQSKRRKYAQGTLDRAKKIVASNGDLPLVFVENFDLGS